MHAEESGLARTPVPCGLQQWCERAHWSPVWLAGLTDMLNTGASVQRFSCTAAAAGGNSAAASARASLLVRGCGRLQLYSTCAPAAATVDGREVQFEFDPERRLLSLVVPRTESLLCTVCLDFALSA